QYPAIDVGASLSRVMGDIAAPDHQRMARTFRALVASYEANRDLVLMGAYRAGADPLLDRAIAMQEPLKTFLGQEQREIVPLEESIVALSALMGSA
ncbi:MAG: flagellum-specific ATP synthase FliI, partial [Sphingomonadales bacterium]|nr:flagellum-specific ATP synthase FliI [Sphingomonadales bacterium]